MKPTVVKLSDLLAARAEIALDFHGVELPIGYRPAACTSAFLEAVAEESIPEALPRIIVDWPLVDDAGKPVPIEKATLEQLPIPLLRSMWAKIREALLPN